MLVSEQLQNLPVVQTYRAEGRALERFDAEQARYLAVMKRSLFIRGAFSPTTEFLGHHRRRGGDGGRHPRGAVGAGAGGQPGLVPRGGAADVPAGQVALAHRLADLAGGGRGHAPVRGARRRGRLRRGRRGGAADAGPAARGRAAHVPGRARGAQGRELRGAPGAHVALVGPLGRRASRACSRCCCGHVLDLGGEVSWNGNRSRALSRRSVRAQLAWVPQEPVLLSGSVRDNLRVGRADATDAQLWAALERAHAAAFVRGLRRRPRGRRGRARRAGSRAASGNAWPSRAPS